MIHEYFNNSIFEENYIDSFTISDLMRPVKTPDLIKIQTKKYLFYLDKNINYFVVTILIRDQ